MYIINFTIFNIHVFNKKKMKFYLTKIFTISLLAAIIFIVYNFISEPILCEAPAPYVTDNLFFKIQETSRGAWNVLFKNVNVSYEVTSSDRTHLGDFKNQNFRLKQINLDTTGSDTVDHTRVNNNVLEAVIDHFNDIQRGNFHTHSPNYINPNAHGKGIGVHSNPHSGINSPLDQFVIQELITLFFNTGGNLKLSFTNMAFYLSISSFIGISLNLLYNMLKGLISSLWSLNKESLYATIHGIVINQINVIKGQKFLPFIYTLFTFIFVSNLIGMIPYNFSLTSHFILTFFISFSVVLGSSLLGFSSKKDRFFSIFVPEGCPTALLPLLVLIEFISYLARNVSLGLRLAANILSGHMLLNILSGFSYNIMASGLIAFFIGLIPLIFISAFSTLEMGICFIQAQVFSVLSSSYIKDGA